MPESIQRIIKKTAGNLLIVLISLLMALLLAEAVSRIFLSPPQKIILASKVKNNPVPANPDKKTLTIHEHPDEGGLYRGSPTGRRLNPNMIVTIENHRLSKQQVLIETNDMGYRNPPIKPKSTIKNHTRRILFLGDSITFQDFLNENQTFVRLIEAKAAANGKEWETINAGVGAISLKTELAILLESGLALEPDVVVLDFYLNDFQESKGVNIITLPLWAENSWFLYHLSVWINPLLEKSTGTNPPNSSTNQNVNLAAWQHEFEQRVTFADGPFNSGQPAFNSMIKNSFADFGGAWSQQSWEYMYPLFEELKRLSLEHHFRLVIVGFPVYPQVYTEFVDDYPQQQLKSIGKKLDVPVLDLLPPLRAEALRLRDPSIYHSQQIFTDLFYDQCHHTPAGSALIADEIYQFLQ